MSQNSDALVFFGATGDLAHKKIFPALHCMVRRGTLDVPVIGVAKAGWTLDDLKKRARESVDEQDDALEKLIGLLHYVDGDYADDDTFNRLRQELGDAQRPLHYLAIPPSLFGTVVLALKRAGCADEGARVVVEKPFGHDLASAQALNADLHQVFPETSVFRIDHYLGKEPVENLTYVRFANRFLEPLLRAEHVNHVQITMAESFGVQGRGKFYEEAGTIRDVVQNHLLQVLSLLGMDPPAEHTRESIRDEKVRFMRSLRPLRPTDVVRGQFNGYRDEDGVAPDSTVETFVAVRLHADSWRWAGVPFLIRAGKELATTATEIIVQLRQPPTRVFDNGTPNRIRFEISPNVVIAFDVRVKKPGEAMVGEDVCIDLDEKPGEEMEPYDRLLGDALHGDQTLFARQDTVEAAWQIVDGILGNVTPIHPYDTGTWGPAEADRLLPPGATWVDPMTSGDPS
jgi:glucose-6-phosphate 1-dehydrogenase